MTQNTEKLLMCLAELNCTVEKTKEGAILITPAKEEVRDKSQYYEGDFMYCEAEVGLVTYKNLCIVDKIEGGTLYVKCNLRSVLGNHHNMIDEDPRACILFKDAGVLVNADYLTARIAKEEEEQFLLDVLHKERKIWNHETRTIEEDRNPRIGDKCVAYNEDIPNHVDVGYLGGYEEDANLPYYLGHCYYLHCVRFKDFDFDTMRPKEL